MIVSNVGCDAYYVDIERRKRYHARILEVQTSLDEKFMIILLCGEY